MPIQFGKNHGFLLVQMCFVMNEVVLEEVVDGAVKIGEKCMRKKPNITEDTIFILDGVPFGFYIKRIDDLYSRKLLRIANKEFRSKNVPKTVMGRSAGQKEGTMVKQFSSILGSVLPRPHNRRPYKSISSVHRNKKAGNFIKAMLLLAKRSEGILDEILPEIYKAQKEIIKMEVAREWRFGNIFTSSITNYNISAPYHRDTGNLKGTVNCIYTKRFDAKGGYLDVPKYDITIECEDESLTCYPAWKDIHGVTPIMPNSSGGYRNSFIFYPLKGFE